MDTCRSETPDIVLIAGDLFDSSRVSDKDVADCLTELARVRIPICIVNGNHDALEPPSIYDRIQLLAAGPHVHFFGDESGSLITFDDISLSIWARAMVAHTPSNQPLAGYGQSSQTHWHVAMAHGHFVKTLGDELRSSLIPAEQIEALQCDYLALGHWHRWADVSVGRTTAHYAGSPSDQLNSEKTVNLVTLETGARPTVRRIDVS
jgi:DNA repair exonuclease SbcCD nuclease subunit